MDIFDIADDDFTSKVDEYMANLSTDKLIDIVADPLHHGIEIADAAVYELYDREPQISIELGVKAITTNDGDEYFQDTIWNLMFKAAPERFVQALCDRQDLLKAVMLSAILYEYEIWLCADMTHLPKACVDLIVNSYPTRKSSTYHAGSRATDEQLQAGYEEFLRRVGRA